MSRSRARRTSVDPDGLRWNRIDPLILTFNLEVSCVLTDGAKSRRSAAATNSVRV